MAIARTIRVHSASIVARLHGIWRRALLRAVCGDDGRVRPRLVGLSTAEARTRWEAEYACRRKDAAPICERAADIVARMADLDADLPDVEAALRRFRIRVVDHARRDAATAFWREAFTALPGVPDRILFVSGRTPEIGPDRDDGATTLVVATDDPDVISATLVTPDGRRPIFARPASLLSPHDRAEFVSWLMQALRPRSVDAVDSRAYEAAMAYWGDGLSTLRRFDDRPISGQREHQPWT